MERPSSEFRSIPVGFSLLILFILSIQKVAMTKSALAVAFSLLAATLGLAACGSSSSSSGKQLALVAYSTPQGAYGTLIPAFQATPDGKGVGFSQSYGWPG